MNKEIEETEEMKTSYFPCACGSRDHMIIAYYTAYLDEPLDDICLSFKATHCYRGWSGWRLTNFFRSIIWRIREVLKLLILGYVEIEDEWIPSFWEEDGLENLAKWLIESNRLAKENLIKKSKKND